MSEPDWIYDGSDAEWSPVSNAEVFEPTFHDPGMFYVGSVILPIESRVARLGVKGVLQQVTDAGEVIVTVQVHRGLRGWPARRWIKRHPLQLTIEIFRPEWNEWRTEIGTVRLSR